MNTTKLFFSLCMMSLLFNGFAADPPPRERMWEFLINERVMEYPLKTENLFRLAVYTELKGHYLPSQDALNLEFGTLGRLQFFEGHCLLKTFDGQVFSVERGTAPTIASESLDASLDELFDRMPLLNDATGNPEVIAHVDAHLSRKNLEPFDKLFLRHLLVHYGKYNAALDAVEFHSDWLAGSEEAVNAPLKIRLDSRILRGFYLNSGGTVYVEDVSRTVAYATGEEYGHNVTAFKVFMEDLLVRSVQYVVQEDTRREPIQVTRRPSGPLPVGYASQAPQAGEGLSTEGVEGLYLPQRWMNLMLGVLRAKNINIGDEDVIKYFVKEEYFNELYLLLLPEEREQVERYLSRHNLVIQP